MFRKSLLGFEWKLSDVSTSKSLGLMQKFSLPYYIADIISSKDLPFGDIEDFLNPSIRKLLPNPFFALMDVELATTRIIKAIDKNEKIVIFGDYDVDGACSSAIFKKYFRSIGKEVEIYIPDRIKEGYGPNTNALLEIRKNGADLVITVDCGTVAFEPIKEAKNAGLEVVVIDHHLGVKEKPESIAVINPNRWDETSDFTYLCGAGVSFLVVLAVNMRLKELGYFKRYKKELPNLLSLIDLVALGTVCDVMPLVGLNRAFVKTGIEVIKAKTNIGIKALLSVSGSETEVTEYTLGFIIGPRINAGGRVGRADAGANLLASENLEEALKISSELEVFNVSRKDIESQMLHTALQKVEANEEYKNNIIFVQDESFHQGVIGILASKIKEKYNKPAAVFARADGYLKASLRSIDGVDIGMLIHSANTNQLIMAGGGHKMAGALSVMDQNFPLLQKFFNQKLESMGALEFYNKKKFEVSTVLSLSGINSDLAQGLRALSPFGNANPKPIFAVRNLVVLKVNILKERHASFILKDEISSKTMKAIFFNVADYGIISDVLVLISKKIDVLCDITTNEWNGQKNLQLQLIDIAI